MSWTPERRAAQAARMRANNPMRRPGVAAKVVAARPKPEGAPPCPPDCTCARHDSAARRDAALTRWDKPGQREAQAEVGRRVLTERWSDPAAVDRARRNFAYLAAKAYADVVPPPDVPEVWGVEALLAQAKRLGITTPQPPTLRRYGITMEEWLHLLQAQGWRCPICQRRVAAFNTDHHHVAGWKHMPPEERRRYVRGLLCPYDNYRIVHSRMTGEVARRIAAYLTAYEARRDNQRPPGPKPESTRPRGTT